MAWPLDAQVKCFVICNCLNIDLLSHLPSSHNSSQSSDWTISAVNFLQTKNISLQTAKCYLSINFICFMFLVELNRLVSRFKATKVITQVLFTYFSTYFVSERKSTTLGILQAFLQALQYMKEQMKKTHRCKFSIKLRIYILK